MGRRCLSLHAIAHRPARDEGGFTLLETVAAMGVVFVALLALAGTSLVGLPATALARQRQGANQLANQLLEQVRGLTYATMAQGLATSDLGGDPSRIKSCAGVYYYKSCGSGAEPIVHTDGLPTVAPLVPHQGSVGPPTHPLAYAWGVYVTRAGDAPQAGALRVRVVVRWTKPNSPWPTRSRPTPCATRARAPPAPRPTLSPGAAPPSTTAPPPCRGARSP